MILYLDTSSVVKIYVHEAGSADVRHQVNESAMVTTSVVAYAETRAALARHRRARALTPAAFAEAKRMFEHDWASFVAVEVTEPISRTAGALADRHGLRGFDAIHLASFQQILERAGDEDVQFSSFDDRLTRAARRLQ